MKFFLSAILTILLPYIHTCAQSTLPTVLDLISDTSLRLEIDTAHRQVLEDKQGKWTINEVNKLPLTERFRYSSILQPVNDSVFAAYWFRYRIKNKTGKQSQIAFSAFNETSDFFILRKDGKWQHLISGYFSNWEKKDGLKAANVVPFIIFPNEELLIYERIGVGIYGSQMNFDIALTNPEQVIREIYVKAVDEKTWRFSLNDIQETFFIGFLFFAAFFNFFFFAFTKEKLFLYFTFFVFFLSFNRINAILGSVVIWGNGNLLNYITYIKYSWSLAWISLFLFFREAFQLKKNYPRWDIVLKIIYSLFGLITLLRLLTDVFKILGYVQIFYIISLFIEFLSMEAIFITLILFSHKKDRFTKQVVIGAMPLIFLWAIVTQFSSNSFFAGINFFERIKIYLDNNIGTMQVASTVWFILLFSWFLFIRFNMLRKESAQKSLDNERLAKEKEIERNELILKQKIELEEQVVERTADLKQSLDELKSTQAQLIQSEKMASLGELTAGIAHEIQNPLNFVNNFSDVNTELLTELIAERLKPKAERDESLEANIINDVIGNEEKINHHGKRADIIVKSMLQHSRTSTGKKESTDINALADEYLRLSYHGLRAKDKDFNADFKTDFDESIGKIEVVPQDIGRVLLNLFNNAFYSVNEKKKKSNGTFEPTVTVTTKRAGDKIELSVKDNGTGIPQNVLDKIYQPFFTTKPTGEGTGLGLSLSYDIIKAHSGELKVETKEGEGATFTLIIPSII